MSCPLSDYPERFPVLLRFVFFFVGLTCFEAGGASTSRGDQSSSSSIASSNANRTQIDANLADRLYHEAPQAWERLRERMKTQKGSYRKSKSGAGVGWAPRSTRVDYAISGENMKASFQRDGVEIVFAKNEDYAFSISRRAEDRDSRYTIQWLEQSGTDAAIEAQISEQESEYCENANAPWSFMGRLFSEWWSEPGFSIEGVGVEDIGGVECVRVDYSYLPPETSATNIESIPSAYVVYDVTNAWALRESVTYAPWGVHRGICEYAEQVDGFPALTKWRTVTEGNDGAKMEVGVEFDGITYEPTPSVEFRLAHYGLPEPNFESRRLMTWLAYVVAGGACLGLAHMLRRRRRAVG